MNNKFLLPIFLAICLFVVTMTIVSNNELEHYTLHSVNNDCTIDVQTKSTPELGTIYIITYTDYTDGTITVERETSKADMEYMVHVFQEYCYTTHNK